MNKLIKSPFSNILRLFIMATFVMVLTVGTGLTAQAAASPARLIWVPPVILRF